MSQKIFHTICHSIEGPKHWGFMNDDYTITVCMEQFPTQEEAFIKAKEMYFDMVVDGFKDISEYDDELDILKEYLFEMIDSHPGGIIMYPLSSLPPDYTPEKIMEIYKQTGNLIFNSKKNEPSVTEIKPWTFDQWKENRNKEL